MEEKGVSGVLEESEGTGKAVKNFWDKTKNKAVKIMDQNDDGKFDMTDVAQIAGTVGNVAKRTAVAIKNTADAKARELELKLLQPIFAENITDANFSLTKLIRICDHDGSKNIGYMNSGSMTQLMEYGGTELNMYGTDNKALVNNGSCSSTGVMSFAYGENGILIVNNGVMTVSIAYVTSIGSSSCTSLFNDGNFTCGAFTAGIHEEVSGSTVYNNAGSITIRDRSYIELHKGCRDTWRVNSGSIAVLGEWYAVCYLEDNKYELFEQ